jgi:hypothetical protein
MSYENCIILLARIEMLINNSYIINKKLKNIKGVAF